MARRRRRRYDYDYDYRYYAPSTPIEVEGGIKARGGRGKLGGSEWWSKRWIQVIESFDLGARLTRGRTYARKGQVLDIAVEPGLVTAKVQGSRSSAYRIAIRAKVLSSEEWERVLEALRARAAFLAKLLAGEMPADIEEAFAAAQVSLFVGHAQDLDTDCSCPDWSNPCKHIAAVFYVLGEEFDRDPFLLFTLRGLSRDELLARIAAEVSTEAQGDARSLPPEPISPDTTRFWSGTEWKEPQAAKESPTAAAPLLLRLGNLPFWRGERSMFEVLAPTYRLAEQRVVGLLSEGARHSVD